ncbi:MAG: hypothetical protein MRJ68_10390 [Nitrospira sp.]|nr:hypothetical protein [Nitrospira sp.]
MGNGGGVGAPTGAAAGSRSALLSVLEEGLVWVLELVPIPVLPLLCDSVWELA